MRKWSIEDKIAIVLLVIAALFRFWNYAGWSLSNDELSALTRLKYDSFAEMIQKGVRDNDMHPMGVQSFLWWWTSLFGTGEAIVRLPFVLLGIATAGLLYLTGRNMFGKGPAIAALAVFSALQFPILYAQLARPYSPGLFFCMLTAYAWSQMCLVHHEWKWREALLLVIGGTGAMYAHYFSFMVAGIICATGYFLLPKKNWLRYTLCGLAMMVLYLPNVSVFLAQFSIGGLGGPEGWLGPPGKDAVWNYLIYCFNEQLWLFLFLFGAGLAFAFLYQSETPLRKQLLLSMLFFFLPALIAYFYSILKNPVFQYSILLFSFPFILLVLFSRFRPTVWKPVQYFQLTALLLVTAYSTIVAQGFYSRQFFAPFKLVAEKMAEYNALYSDKGEVLNAVNVIHPDYIHYYSDRLQPQLKFSQYICNKPDDIIALRNLAATTSANTLVHGWCNNYHAPELEWMLREYFPYLLQSDTFFNAGVMVFSKIQPDKQLSVASADFKFFNDFDGKPWENDSLFKSDDQSFSGKFSLLMRPEQEYGPTIRKYAGEMGLLKDVTMMFSCKAKADTAIAELKLVVQVQRGEESVLWRGLDIRPYQKEFDQWFSAYAGYKIQEELNPDDVVSIYFYNPYKEKVWLDDVRFEVYK